MIKMHFLLTLGALVAVVGLSGCGNNQASLSKSDEANFGKMNMPPPPDLAQKMQALQKKSPGSAPGPGSAPVPAPGN